MAGAVLESGALGWRKVARVDDGNPALVGRVCRSLDLPRRRVIAEVGNRVVIAGGPNTDTAASEAADDLSVRLLKVATAARQQQGEEKR